MRWNAVVLQQPLLEAPKIPLSSESACVSFIGRVIKGSSTGSPIILGMFRHFWRPTWNPSPNQKQFWSFQHGLLEILYGHGWDWGSHGPTPAWLGQDPNVKDDVGETPLFKAWCSDGADVSSKPALKRYCRSKATRFILGNKKEGAQGERW